MTVKCSAHENSKTMTVDRDNPPVYVDDVGWLTPEQKAVIDQAEVALFERVRRFAILSSPEHAIRTLNQITAVLDVAIKNPTTDNVETLHSIVVKQIGTSKHSRSSSAKPEEQTSPFPPPDFILAVWAASSLSASAIGRALHSKEREFGATPAAIAKKITRIRNTLPTAVAQRVLVEAWGKMPGKRYRREHLAELAKRRLPALGNRWDK